MAGVILSGRTSNFGSTALLRRTLSAPVTCKSTAKSNDIGQPFNPVQLGNALKIWLDATVGVTEAAGAVSAWADRSPSAHSYQQATGGSQPTYSATGWDGQRPSISFDAVDNLVSAANFTPVPQPWWVFMVVDNWSGGLVLRDSLDARATVYKPSSNQASIYYGGSVTSTLEANVKALFSGYCNSDSSELYENSVLDATTDEIATNALGFAGATMRLGPGPMELAELLIVEGELSDETIAGIETYLAQKWAIADLLPNTHQGYYSSLVVGATGVALETSTALGLGAKLSLALGLATETDTALARGVARPVGLATEASTNFNLSAVLRKETGLAAEGSTALGLTAKLIKPIGLAAETSAALALGQLVIASVGLSSETSIALGLGAARPVGVAAESSDAFALGALLAKSVGFASETSTAFELALGGPMPVGIATESSTAVALTGRLIIPVGMAEELSLALVPATFGAFIPVRLRFAARPRVYAFAADNRAFNLRARPKRHSFTASARFFDFDANPRMEEAA